jgi:outer membrane protein, heavy metal efflux system
MLFAALLLFSATIPTQQDTIRFDADVALHRAVEHSPVLAAVRQRAEGAARGVDQARLWSNPQLQIATENVGATRRMAGVETAVEREGQAVVSGVLPLGGDRRAAIARSAAERSAAVAATALAETEVRFQTLRAVAEAERDRRLVQHAAEERADLDRFADMLARGVEQGRFPAGHAARAELAAVLAATEEARRAAAAAGSAAELARLLGLAAGTPVRVDVPPCVAPLATLPIAASPVPLPEESVAEAHLVASDASVALTRARTVPDLHPQLGIRRVGGVSGLYLGFAVELPAFDRGGAGIAAARAEREAVRAERDDLAGRLAADRVAAAGALRSYEGAGARFTADWAQALERSVTASRTAYELGDGTLTELLDARRARLGSLDDHARWQAEVRVARARADRLSGGELGASLLCHSTDTITP